MASNKRPKFHGKKSSVNLGRRAFNAYCDDRNLEAIERKQHYTATDLIADVLHYARSRGWDVETILSSARNHLSAETSSMLVNCAKCGMRLLRSGAVIDYGTPGTEEEGRVFYYCSDECWRKH